MRARIASIFLALILIFLMSTPSSADMRNILTFRDVEIPWALKQGDLIIEEGTYDVLLIKHGVTLFCLKFRQNGKTICVVENPQKIDYANQDSLYELLHAQDVPKEATLHVKRNPVLKTVYFVVETGNCRHCRFHKFRFQMESTET
jgi:hypothetical protein